MKVPGANLGIGALIDSGSCACCANFKSAHFWAGRELSSGSTWPVRVEAARVELYVNSSGGTAHTVDADVTPIEGEACQDLFYRTFTLDLIEGGETVGSVKYQYISGDPSGYNSRVNLTILYGGHEYKIENGGAEGAYIQGLNVYRHDFTEIDGVRQ